MAARTVVPRLRCLQLVQPEKLEPLYETAILVIARSEALALLENRYHLLISECGKLAHDVTDEEKRFALETLHNAWKHIYAGQ